MEHSVHAETQLPSTKIKGAFFTSVQKHCPQGWRGATYKQEIPSSHQQEGLSAPNNASQQRESSPRFHSNSNVLSFTATHPFVQQTLYAGPCWLLNLEKNQNPGQIFFPRSLGPQGLVNKCKRVMT